MYATTNLLDKFASIEVTADTRIDAADRHYCQMQQKAYEHGRDSLKQLIEMANKLYNEQGAIFENEGYETYSTFMSGLNISQIEDVLEKTHGHFIDTIFEYFRRKYSVDVNSYDARVNLLPSKPSTSLWHRNDDEWETYETTLKELSLSYQSIVDQVFLQLGGLTFADKAVKEIKDAAHAAAWNEWRGTKCYEQKKAIVSLSYGCSFDDWWEKNKFSGRTEHHITFFDSTKNVIRAIIHSEYGATDYYPAGLLELMGYYWKTEDTEITVSMDCLKSVKCFKNGRVDFRFASEGHARQFVEEYLGMTA